MIVLLWWDIEDSILKFGHITSLPLIFGLFLVATLWIFHYAYDKGFWMFFITNDTYH